MDNKKVEQKLLQVAMGSKNYITRARAIDALAAMEITLAEPDLDAAFQACVDLMHYGHSDAAASATSNLHYFYDSVEFNKAAADALLNVMLEWHPGSEKVAIAAVNEFVFVGIDHDNAYCLDAVVDLFEKANQAVVDAAVSAIVRIGEVAIPVVLAAAVGSRDSGKRHNAAMCIIKMFEMEPVKSDVVVDAMTELMFAPDEHVSYMAVNSLAHYYESMP